MLFDFICIFHWIMRWWSMSSMAIRQFFFRSKVAKIGLGIISWKMFCIYEKTNNTLIKCSPIIKLQDNKQILLEKNSKQNFLDRLIQFLKYLKRFIYLVIIFLPTILALPLYLTPFRKIFIYSLTWSVQQAGVVFIKMCQYLSHRSDIIGQQMAEGFQYLRQFNKQHSLRQTQQIFENIYHKKIQELFEDFNDHPIASGSIGQVYQALYKGQLVAVKVRHPKVDTYIKRDITILFFLSKLLSKVSKIFDLPVNKQSLQRTLSQQISFLHEQSNIQKFRVFFKDSQTIHFPQTYNMTKDQVLVQKFVNGYPITYYIKKPEKSKEDILLNRVMSRIGTITFFQMLMKYNLVHADCHGGNIMIEVKDISESTFIDAISFNMKQLKSKIQNYFIKNFFLNNKLKQLFEENELYVEELTNIQKSLKKKIQVTLIDVGMAIQLKNEDKRFFIKFIEQLILGNPSDCANMIYRITTRNNQLIVPRHQNESSNQIKRPILNPQYPQYFKALQLMFSQIRTQQMKISQIQAIKVLKGMLNVIRNHSMKLDGDFATLMTNMLVLQSIAKHLDPQINILRCAIPYFIYNK